MPRTNLSNAYESQLSSPFGPTDTTVNVVSTGDLTHPCRLVIDPDDESKREYIYFDSNSTATTFTCSDVTNRYLDGSAAPSGITHDTGAVVRSAPAQQHFEEVWDELEDLTNQFLGLGGGTLTGALTMGVPAAAAAAAIQLNEGYGLYADNTGPGSANNRFWINAPDGGAVYIGPRSGGQYLDQMNLRAASILDGDDRRISRIVTGTYTGDGSASLTETLGFNPIQVNISTSGGGGIFFISPVWEDTNRIGASVGLRIVGSTITLGTFATEYNAISTGFSVAGAGAGGLNQSGVAYAYVARG